MYRLLLVEDEEEIRQGIAEAVDWRGCGFELVGQAADGLDALELFEKLAPDLILTDIRMHYMDGLTLIERVREQNAGVYAIILSGYDDFEYARQALRRQVLDYILKPASARTIMEVLTRAREKLDAERQAQKSQDAMRQSLIRQLPLLRQSFLSGLLSSSDQSEEALSSLAVSYQSALSFPLTVGALYIDESEGKTRLIDEEYGGEPALLRVAVADLVREYLEGGIIVERSDHLALLIPGDAIASARTLQETIRFLLGLPVTIGLSTACECYRDVPARYETALLSLDKRFLGGGGRVYVPDESTNASGGASYDAVTDDLDAVLREGDDAALGRFFAETAQRFAREHMSSAAQTALVCQCAGRLIRLGARSGVDMEKGVAESGLEDVFRGSHAQARIAALENLARYVKNAMREGLDDPGRRLAAQAREYLEANFSRSDLTLDDICGALHVSQSQFGLLFKRETGQSFLQYLIDMRLRAACQLLKTTALKAYEVADRTGFSDPNYFSYCFRRRMGMTPVEYRRGKGDTP